MGIALILWTTPKESFQDMPSELAIPLISPRYQTLVEGEVKPFASPSTSLLAPPPGQSASVNTQPAENPASEKATAGRIQSVFESMDGFFKREASGLRKIGDPSVQLPLSTARSDMTRLKDEMVVLQRNPGLQSSLTQDDVDGVEANLAYLQKKWRLSTNAMSGGPMPEGFQSGSGVFSWLFGGTQEGFQSSSGSGSLNSDVTLEDLKELSLKIGVEILRLESSGSTDLNVQARVKVLLAIKQVIDDIVADVTSGKRLQKDIPLMRADIVKFLPNMANINTAIPELIKQGGFNSFLNNLFPNFAVGDISGAAIAKQIFDAYGKNFLNNLSWDVALKYKGQAEQDIASNYAIARQDAKITAETEGSGRVSGIDSSSAYSGVLGSVIQSTTGMTATSVGAGMGNVAQMTVHSPSTTATPLDWKERSKQICAQISARGLDPNDFGCLANPDDMKQESFSWRGYGRMVCSRLNTVYDTSVPALCGCPPPTWPGWRQ